MVDVPAVTDATLSVLLIERSATRMTASVSVAESFDASGSPTGAETMETVFTRVTISEAGGTASVS